MTTCAVSTALLGDEINAGGDDIVIDDRAIRKSSLSGALIDAASIVDDIVRAADTIVHICMVYML